MDDVAKKSFLSRWTRDGILHFSWSLHESIEKLVLSPPLHRKLVQCVELFLKSQLEFNELGLPWRHGLFFFGPSGCGKTAAGRALARLLNWHHLTIPAHEILDSHLFERALADAVSQLYRVIVLEDIDMIIRTMEPSVFFTLLDHAMERAEGTLWIASTRRPEDTPKTQLIRPGRFEESIRFEPPGGDLRRQLLDHLMIQGGLKEDTAILEEFVVQTEGLSFSHFEELRQTIARFKLQKKDPSEFWPTIKSYVDDQLIAGDRWGGLRDSTEDLHERVKQIDSRVLTAALDMTDVFRTLIEKVIGDSAEQAKRQQLDEQE
jgi:SpoVK/Ycf46/Vps4 family AAA+-type ATPase